MKKLFSKQNKALLTELVRTDFKLRYQGSVLGYAWSVLKPLFMFMILYLVFGVVLRVGDDIDNYPIYLLFGIMLWNFFGEMTQQSLTSIVDRGDLIRKIAIPRWQIILSTSFGALINLALNMIIIIVIALITGMNIRSTTIYLPVYFAEIYILALGCSLILSTMYVKFRDISYIWDIILQAGFYATPILYPLSLITNQSAQQLIMINPLAQAIQGAREAFVTQDTLTISDVWGSSFAVVLPIVLVVLSLLFGIYYFRKHSKYFAENL